MQYRMDSAWSRTSQSVLFKKQPSRGKFALTKRWAGYAIGLFLTASITVVLMLRWAPPSITAQMLHEQYVENESIAYNWMSVLDMSPHVRLAVVAAEDQRFMSHHGLDFQSIQSAIYELNTPGIRRGSPGTITQQVASNLFLWRGDGLTHRVLEGYFALLIDLIWSKQRILEVYLNTTQFGPGVFGVEAASQQYFKHSSIRLSSGEAARLAAILPNPSRFSPNDPNPYVSERVQWVQQQMVELGGGSFIQKNHL